MFMLLFYHLLSAPHVIHAGQRNRADSLMILAQRVAIVSMRGKGEAHAPRVPKSGICHDHRRA